MMECTDIDSSEREEGEIIDDDLEEISDGSIAPSPKSGKLISPEENLRPISLSSLSDLEIIDSCSSVYKSKRRTRKKRKRKLRIHCQVSSESSSEDEEMVKRKKLLREAICRDDETHNNSLRTRLIKMVQKPVLSQESNDLNCDSVQNNLECSESVTIPIETNNEETNGASIEVEKPIDVDEELIQLRLEALKTAVVNKFQKKKRKAKPTEHVESKTQEINKENSSVNVNSQSCITENSPQISDGLVNDLSPKSAINIEEEIDEDILRAELLASIAKKITQIVSPTALRRNKDSGSLKISCKKPVKPASMKPTIEPPKMSPIIISINNPDSDSDDELNETLGAENIQSRNGLDKQELEIKIDNFLKQQRAEVESKNNRSTPKPRNGDNLKLEKVVKINKDYKFLPQSKQLEYEGLINKLELAQRKRTRVRLPSRSSDTKLQKNKISIRTSENNVTGRSNYSGSQQKLLRQVQQQVNGRLQDKGKYNELSPLVKKMEQVIVEQKKHEILMNKLLKQFNEAKAQSAKLQKLFSGLIQEYLKKKECIDNTTKVVPARRAIVKPTPKVAILKPQSVVSSRKSNDVLPEINHTSNNHGAMQCKIVLEKCDANLKDPNDIEFKTFNKMENTSDVPKYSSPLDFMESQNHKILNPMEILCPYEMNGLCRDKDCIYNHCN